MLNWQDLPAELQLTDADIKSLTTSDVESLFKSAEALGVSHHFSELFWEAVARVRCNPANASIQQCVDFLEERKRAIGRTYSIVKKRYPNGWLPRWQAHRYNECEYNIRWLVEQYGVNRSSKPYLLEVELHES